MAPTQLITFVHPHNAYRLQYPSHWEHLSQDEGRSYGFGPRDRDDIGLWITIMPMSIDTDRIEDELPGIFQQAIDSGEGANVRADMSLRHFGLKADMTKAGEGGCFWMLIGGDLVLFASSQVAVTEREIWNPQFDRLMASLEIMRDRELLLRKTADDVYKRLRELYPEQDYRLEEDAIRGRDQRISLANVYKQVVASPGRRTKIVEQFLEGLASMEENPPGGERLDQVRDNIVPVLKHVAYLKTGTATERLVATDWLGNVVICYAIRSQRILRLLTNWDLNRWHMAHDALHELAMRNLARLPWPERLEGAGRAGGRLIMVATNDSFDASRLLHPDLHRLLCEQLGSRFYAGIPACDTLVAFSGDDPSFCLHVLRQIRRDHDSSAYPITTQAFVVTSRGVALAQLPPYAE